MRPFSDAFLDRYLAAEGDGAARRASAPTGSRTAARSSSPASTGDLFTIMGLPLLELLGFLRTRGIVPRMTAAAAARRRDRLADRRIRARRGCTGTGWRATGSPATTCRSRLPPEDFAAGLRVAAAARLPRRQRDHPAQGGGAGAGDARRASAPRAIGAANTLTFGAGRRDPRRQHRRLRLHRQPAPGGARLGARRPGRRWCSAPAARRGRSSRRCSPRARPRSASPTARRDRAEALRGALRPADRRSSTGRRPSAARGDAATIVNTTLARHGRRRRRCRSTSTARPAARWSPTSSTAPQPTPFVAAAARAAA